MKQETKTNKRPSNGRTKKSGRRFTRFQLVMVLLVSILVLSCGIVLLLLVMPTGAPGASSSSPSLGLFDVKEVQIAGETRYDPELLKEASGIKAGQSVFAVDKKTAVANILAVFPYVDTAVIDSPSYDVVRITITETRPIGAIVSRGQWLVVGANGNGLSYLPIEGEHPPRYLYFKGVEATDAALGQPALEAKTFTRIQALLAAFEKYGLTDVAQIDLTDPGDIRVSWKNQITLALGNASNLDYAIHLAVNSLPALLEKHGATIRAVYDLSAFSDPENQNPLAVFTPLSLFPEEK